MGRILGYAEEECISLVQKVLRASGVKRHYRFDFLRGDPTAKRPKGSMLPVDAYFPEFNLVVEYMGKQHFTENPLMDRRPGRREQRRRYQERRSQTLAAQRIKLVRFRYDEPLTEATVRAKLHEVGMIDESGKVIWKAP